MSYLPRHQWLQALYERIVEHHHHHALILTGDQGVGKTELALALAKYWLDPSYQYNQVLDAGSHPDLYLLLPPDSHYAEEELFKAYGQRFWGKEKTVISTSMVRAMCEKVMQSPIMAAQKVVLLLNADHMSINASNTILKVLEEPPSDTRFILVSPHFADLSPTVRSRCLHYRVQGQIESEEYNDWRTLANNAPLMTDFMLRAKYDETYDLIERVLPVALIKPAAISEAARLLSEKKKHGLWQCLLIWIYQYQRKVMLEPELSQKISDFYLDVFRLSIDANKSALDKRLQLYDVISRHCPLAE